MSAKVSIIIPAKNEELYIRECLTSIVKQTFSDWEAIVVDDHSTDQTVNIIHSDFSGEQRIRVLSNEGKGIISALRTGYKHAQGELISRMDADDRMRANKIAVLSKALHSSGRGYLAVGGVNYFSDQEVKSGFKNYERWLNKHTAKGSNFTDIFKECAIPSPNWMIYRDDLDRIGAFDSDRYPEDYDLAFRMFLNGLKVIPTKEVTHDWRDYPNRTSRVSDVYKDHTFTAIKWYYFDRYFRDLSRQLVLFGTGLRGKRLAKHLIDRKIAFQWVSHNTEKIGKHIYDVRIESLDKFSWENKQIISTIAKDKGRKAVEDMALIRGKRINKDLYHFA